MKTLLCAILLFASSMTWAQKNDPLEGLFQGYDGELHHASVQLVELAEAIPADKYTWRPAAGVRSTGEVLMHIAGANFFLLSQTGQKLPSDFEAVDVEKTAKDKAEVISWLKRSLEAVQKAHAGVSDAELHRKVMVMQRAATVEGVYLRILVHNNEHMGQLVAYARMNGIVPPWSQKSQD